MNFQKLMAEASKIQRNMEKQQEALNNTIFDATAGSGAVKVSINGAGKVQSIEIDDDLLTVENKEILTDYLKLALDEVYATINQRKEDDMGALSASMDISKLLHN